MGPTCAARGCARTCRHLPALLQRTDVFLWVDLLDPDDDDTDLLTDVETFLTTSFNRLNAIRKTLTLFNTIFLPLTFITGIYGMNFENLPGKGQHWGFWVCVGVMAMIAVVMLFLYRRKRWL